MRHFLFDSTDLLFAKSRTKQEHTSKQEAPVVLGKPRPQAIFVIAWLLCLCQTCVGQQDDVLKELESIQAKVRKVVKNTMDACVAISDGSGFGSGVIVSEDGLVLTAAHVISKSQTFDLILPSGETVTAKRLGSNLNIDAGMLKIVDAENLPFVSLSKLDCQVGDWVASMGHSGGFELGRTPPVRTGRVLHVGEGELFSDAVLIGGDSGGPLFDLNEKLIGIHSSIGDSIAHNRHVAISAFHKDWDRLLAGETWGKLPDLDAPSRNKRGKIGVRIDLNADVCKIRLVNENSPAADAGLEPGDIVLEFADRTMTNGTDLIRAVKRYKAGDVCKMKVKRGEKIFKLSVQLK